MESKCSRNSEESLAMLDRSDIERKFLEEKGEIVRGFLQAREIVDRAHAKTRKMICVSLLK